MVVALLVVMASIPYEAWFPGTSSIEEVETVPPAYRGVWGTSAAACKAEHGTERIAIMPRGVDYYESGGRLERVTQSGQDRTIKVRLSYEGEGDFWDKVEVWELNAGGDKLVMSAQGDGSPITLMKCGG